jgi:RND family efflux transporter MFP subunit
MEASEARIRTTEGVIEEAGYAREDSELHAPIAGAILQRNLEVGQLAAPGQVAFLLADIVTVKAVFGVPDRDIVRLKMGRRLSLFVEVMPGRTFSGMVTALAPAADPTTRLFQVEVTLANPGRVLLPGMIVTLSISDEAKSAQPVLTVPLSAVIRGKQAGEQFSVVAVEQNRARHKSVTLGETFGNRIAVSGLRSGEVVVATGPALLEEGQEVRIVP